MTERPLVSAPSGEDIHLMRAMTAGGLLREDQILSRVPQWGAIESSGLLPPGGGNKLRALHTASMGERAETIRKDPDITNMLLRLLKSSSMEGVQYLLALFYDVIRDDTYTLEGMLNHVFSAKSPDEWVSVFIHFIKTTGDVYCRGKAAFVFSALVARAPLGRIDDTVVLDLVKQVANRSIDMGQYAELDFLKNLLKLATLRKPIWNTPNIPTFIVSYVDPQKSVTLYLALFCCWLATFDSEILQDFTRIGGALSVCQCLKDIRTEKVVRIGVRVISNLLACEDAVEILVQEDINQTITLLEYENWRDQELFQEIRDCQAKLNVRIKQFSSFDRYLRELDRGVLRQSLLHSEKFWREHFMQFEEGEFAAVKKLALLLRSEDPETLAVACRDLGEFAYMHPTGKKVLQKLKVKEQVLVLMNHKQRNVALEALLCLQKLMIERWRDVAATS